MYPSNRQLTTRPRHKGADGLISSRFDSVGAEDGRLVVGFDGELDEQIGIFRRDSEIDK